MTRLLSFYAYILYAYIRSMAKDRVRALNTHKLVRDRARSYMARGYGVFNR